MQQNEQLQIVICDDEKITVSPIIKVNINFIKLLIMIQICFHFLMINQFYIIQDKVASNKAFSFMPKKFKVLQFSNSSGHRKKQLAKIRNFGQTQQTN
ncbi:unnamed protein product [Paramecium primaurelia]|uniref:Transmembrane protein n=1 Tax=Paramecium primaurelia TaxID=5886 RepID=A0A8S1MP46_PARPR|nr:unnamed protein product [Paramecium primaurelia]